MPVPPRKRPARPIARRVSALFSKSEDRSFATSEDWRLMSTRFVSAADAAEMVGDGQTVAISGNGAGMISAESIFAALETRFLESGHPKDLTLVHSLGLGDRGALGTNRFAHEGMVRKVIAAHFTWSPKMQHLVRDEKVEAYCLPGGVIQQLLREIGAGRPGLFTQTGLGTFVDPRHGGGRCNRRSKEQVLERLEIDGHEVLHYKPFRVDVAIIRATFADTRGNLSPEAEQVNAVELWMSDEQGAHNGRLLDGRLFGAARNADAIVSSVDQFDFYSGGGVDIAFLGMGEIDEAGNVNVSHLGGNIIGPGGFIEIAQYAHKVVFCGSFDAQGTELAWSDGRLAVVRPGK